MSLIVKLFLFYVQSNIHVSISAALLVMITGKYLNLNTLFPAVFVGLSTFFSYNLIRFLKSDNKLLKQEIKIWFDQNLKSLLALNFMVFILLLFCAMKLTLREVIFIIPFALCTLFYMLPSVVIFKRSIFLRNVPGLKIFLIAFSWAGLTTLYPAYHNFYEIGSDELLLFINRLLFVIVWTIPFDIRDLDFDSHDLKTIPRVIGLKYTKVLSIVILLVSLLITRNMNIPFVCFQVEGVVSIVLLLLVLKSTRKQSQFYASFWVEGIPILWWSLLIIADRI